MTMPTSRSIRHLGGALLLGGLALGLPAPAHADCGPGQLQVSPETPRQGQRVTLQGFGVCVDTSSGCGSRSHRVRQHLRAQLVIDGTVYELGEVEQRLREDSDDVQLPKGVHGRGVIRLLRGAVSASWLMAPVSIQD